MTDNIRWYAAPTWKSGLTGGVIGAVLSGAVNYFVIPMPETLLANALGHFASGGISGFLAGFMGLYSWMRAQSKSPIPRSR